MKVNAITSIHKDRYYNNKDKYKGIIKAVHIGGFNGRKIPDELKAFIHKHVKTSASGNHYINQYNDTWYANAFEGNMGIYDFTTFLKVISPYFTIQKTIHK